MENIVKKIKQFCKMKWNNIKIEEVKMEIFGWKCLPKEKITQIIQEWSIYKFRSFIGEENSSQNWDNLKTILNIFGWKLASWKIFHP